MTVRTRTVGNRMIGQARKELKDAAGSNQILSKTEAKKLSKDVARAAEGVRKEKGRVTVGDAVDAFASKVNRTLAAVDTQGAGVLSDAEARAIRDPALRSRALDVRAALVRGEDDGGTQAPRAAALMAALAGPLGPLEAFHESGDHGVNITMRKVPGRTADAVLEKLHLDPEAPWTHSDSNVTWSRATGAAAVASFTSAARNGLEGERDDMPAEVDAFVEAVTAQFGALADVRLAQGADLGTRYLVGRAGDGYVALALQVYSDG